MPMLFWLLLLIHAPLCFAENTSAKLSSVMQQIQSVQKIIYKGKSEQSNLEKQLRSTETAINRLSLQLLKTNKELEAKTEIIKKLTQNQNTCEANIKQQQQFLVQQIQLAYLLGIKKNNFAIFFQSEDPYKIDRFLVYQSYLNKKRSLYVSELKNSLLTVKTSKTRLQHHIDQLTLLKQQQVQEQNQLDQKKKNREELLKLLTLQVKNHTERLTVLLENKKSLEKIIKKLQNKQNYSSDFLNHHKGKFPWPTQGKIIEAFGSRIENSELKQNGVIIGAPEGQKVYSVAPGQVIFADWMPGYGLLMIIDHGKGYMTLYGNNGVLYKKAHDVIANQELIATIGHSGGQKTSGLYFALRYQGKPIDPAVWCGS